MMDPLFDAPDFATAKVADVFAALPDDARTGMLILRALIFEIAAAHPEVGALQETLKWGQPSYLTPETGAGSTIRLAAPKAGGFGLYAHCQTTIISEYSAQFGGLDVIDGNRAILFSSPDQIDHGRHGLLIASALTYHLRKKG